MFRIDRNTEGKLQLSRGAQLLELERDDAEVSALLGARHKELEEVRKYSITPTTFKIREFIDNSEIFEALSGDLAKIANDISGLTERSEHFKGSTKRSFDEFRGISAGVIDAGEFTRVGKDIEDLTAKFIEKVASLAIYQSELESCQRLLSQGEELPLFFQELYSNDGGNTVNRFGLNMASMTAAQIAELSSISTPVTKAVSIKSKSSKSSKGEGEVTPMLYPLEILLFRNAMLELDIKKTALVDIFARNDDGSIKIEDNQVETHTICLFKQLESGISQIIIIDPSSYGFSKHLPASAERILLHDDGSHKIILPGSQEFKIYASPNKDMVGPRPKQYRDCVDISVKLAFEFNLVSGFIDIRSNAFIDVVRSITNQEKVMKSLFFDSTQAVMRIKQASDDRVRQEVNNLVVKINQQIESIEEYFPTRLLDKEVEAKSIAIFQIGYLPAQYSTAVETFKNQYRINGERFIELIEQDGSVMLGGEDEGVA